MTMTASENEESALLNN